MTNYECITLTHVFFKYLYVTQITFKNNKILIKLLRLFYSHSFCLRKNKDCFNIMFTKRGQSKYKPTFIIIRSLN